LKVSREFNVIRFLVGIIIIIIRHHLSLDRTVSASSYSLFKGLPSRLRPFGLQFNIIFSILLLFIPVTCRSQFDLHLLSFSSPGFTANSSKISSFFLWSKKDVPGCSEKFRFHVKERGEAVHYILLVLKFLNQTWFESVV